jgi:hypothetical protein
MLALNYRINYAAHSLGIAAFNTPNTILTARGVQTVGLNGRANIQYIYEVGHLPVYSSYEEVPDVEITVDKVLDGYAPISCLATQGAPAATLVGRSNQRCHVYASVHRDNQSRASGGQLRQAFASGMYLSSVGFDFTTNAPFRESVTLVGNNLVYTTGSFVFTGHTATHGVANLAPTGIGVARSQHLDMPNCRFPLEIPGISSSGTNDPTVGPNGEPMPSVPFQSIRTNVSLGRQGIPALGQRGPYFRFAELPADVTTTFEFMSLTGAELDLTEVGTLPNGDNFQPQTIRLRTQEGLRLDLGSQNRFTSHAESGGDAGQSTSNRMLTFTYVNKSDMTIQHTADPTIALRP